MPFAGETVTIFTAADENQINVFHSTFAGFEERTGIDVVVEGSPEFETNALIRSQAGDPYDILNFPQPGLMADMARDGFLVNLNEFLTEQEVGTALNQSWIDLGTVDGTLVGLMHTADMKSLVWYPKDNWDAAGFQIPQTWQEMLNLTQTISEMGVTPWCVGVESGGATGWPATDWVEDVMLRTTSPENYDAWTRGELKFDSPEVRNAFEMVGEIWFAEGYVRGGTTGILTTAFGDAPLPLFDEPQPGCYLHRQASFIPNFFPEGSELGVDVDYFYLPPIDPAFGKPVLGSGNLVSLAKDTPAGREVMRFMLTAESAEAEVKAGNAIAAVNGVPADWYPSSTMAGFGAIMAAADTFRFDGSDLMPGAVGAGSFWTGAVDWIGGADLTTVLQTIDSTWPAE
jgi:alpha-glucoside transport system substrate-binding protein